MQRYNFFRKHKTFLTTFFITLTQVKRNTGQRLRNYIIIYTRTREKVEAIVKHEMESACQMSVPLIADTGWGSNWLEAH